MHIISEALNLAGVYQDCVFHSDERVASHAHVASELSDHDLFWRRGAVDTALFKARINQLQLMVLRYGAQVEVRPQPFPDFALVHMSLQGCTEFDCDGQRVEVPQGRTAIIAPKKNIRMLWGEGSEQLILKVPHALLREAGGIAAGTREAQAPPPSALLLSPALSLHWKSLLQSLLNIAALPSEEGGHAAWIDHFERNVALFLTSQYQPPAAPPASLLERGDGCHGDASAGKRLDALDRYMRAKLCAPVALADLAQAAGASVRNLNILCNRHHGVSPMELLRNLRLDAAHAQFIARPAASVAEVALEFGFGHPGRFAGYYRQRFGHLPKHVNAA